MSFAGSSSEEHNDDYIANKLTVLCQLPSLLAEVDEQEVLGVTIRKVLEVYPGVAYIRTELVGKELQTTELLEWSRNKQIPAALASIQGSETSQQAAMRRGMPVHTQQLQTGNSSYADWQLLQQQFGMQSFAAVPLMLSGTVHGVIMAASAQTACFSPRNMQLLETVGNMLAPYAAVMFKYEQIKSTRRLMAQVLPERVVDAAVQRLHIGGLGAGDLFVPTHHGPQPPQQEDNYHTWVHARTLPAAITVGCAFKERGRKRDYCYFKLSRQGL